jgi:Rrf2 family protein
MRLELSRRGDYAMRAMVALARLNSGQITGPALAKTTGIPPAFVAQVMGGLVRAGLVAAKRGRRGGYRLTQAPESISLRTVVESVEGDSRRQACVLRGGPCGRDGTCDLHDAFFRAQEALFESLDGVSLRDVTR